MHLSLLSDGFLSDSIADARDAANDGESSFVQALRDGLLRGVMVVLTLAIPLTLTVVLTPARGTAPHPRETTTHIRVTNFAVR